MSRSLGMPITDELGTPNKPGRYNHFVKGSIYFSASTGAQDVSGPIRNKWASLGWENSHLGFPVHGQRNTPNKPGSFNRFQGGMIYWSPATGAHEIHGPILDTWARLGYENSVQGFPTSSVITRNNGSKVSYFQNNWRIEWNPGSSENGTGTSVIYAPPVKY